MISDYQNTPSFYNNESYFSKYLGCTSYYISLQNVVRKIVSIIKPQMVLELGSALGTTSIKLSQEYKSTQFKGVDMRSDVVNCANSQVSGIGNVSFVTFDMCQYAKSKQISENDLIYMLYSFHHIPDPINKKIEFLEDCFHNMKNGAYLLITETFLPESVNQDLRDDIIIHKLFKKRAEEGYASTFWNALESLSDEGINVAKSVANVSREEEQRAGELVNIRKDEYLVKLSWLLDLSTKIGYKIILCEPVNSIMEYAILLNKE